MIELVKERTFSTKDDKLKIFKTASSSFDTGKNKFLKFTCSTISAKKRDYDYPIFLAMNNGLLLTLIISKQKSVNIFKIT